MKALLDTNIIIHREANKIVSQDIGILYRWLDRGKYTKCIHSATIEEIKKNPNKETVKLFLVKLDSYETIEIPSPIQDEVKKISESYDRTENDLIDTSLLNEVFVGRVDILITEDKKIHKKANALFMDTYTGFNTTKYEKEADLFAMELLVPDETFLEYQEYTTGQIARALGYDEELIKLKLK